MEGKRGKREREGKSTCTRKQYDRCRWHAPTTLPVLRVSRTLRSKSIRELAKRFARYYPPRQLRLANALAFNDPDTLRSYRRAQPSQHSNYDLFLAAGSLSLSLSLSLSVWVCVSRRVFLILPSRAWQSAILHTSDVTFDHTASFASLR